MRRVSKEWQLRKRWTTELYMNTGIDEGQEWLGSLRSAGHPEFTSMAGTIRRACRISDFARFGAVWATKNAIGKLAAHDRRRLKYGVRRRNQLGQDVLVPCVFSTVDRLTDLSAGSCERLKEIARLPVTEITDMAPADSRAGRDAARDPS